MSEFLYCFVFGPRKREESALSSFVRFVEVKKNILLPVFFFLPDDVRVKETIALLLSLREIGGQFAFTVFDVAAQRRSNSGKNEGV